MYVQVAVCGAFYGAMRRVYGMSWVCRRMGGWEGEERREAGKGGMSAARARGNIFWRMGEGDRSSPISSIQKDVQIDRRWNASLDAGPTSSLTVFGPSRPTGRPCPNDTQLSSGT